MNRRNFLKRVGSIPAFSFLSPLLSKLSPAAPKPFRRVRPSDPDWPSAEKWGRLREQVGGRLIPVTSPLGPCKDSPGTAACAARLEELQNPYFLGEQPGATQLSGWLDAWTSAPSVYAVAAQRAEDVVGGGQLRPRQPPAPRRQGGRAQLSGHLERARLAADLDPRDERHHPA